MIHRLPIRLRLTLPFALAMALVLAALGGFVYVRVGSTLLASVDAELHGQLAETAARLADPARPLVDADATSAVAQVLDASGRVERSTPERLPSLLDEATLRRVRRSNGVHATRAVPGLDGEWRLRAVQEPDGRVVVVARSLTSRTESLEHLRDQLLLAAPLALLLTTLAGYVLAGAALRPVEAMRREAEAVSASEPGRRLPVPPAEDELSRLAHTLNDMLDRLEAALEHERRFVSDASHELRTPLSLLRTELDLALRRPRSHDELEDALRSAAAETERLSALAEQLLLLARSEQGSLPIHRRRVSARALLADVAARFETRAATAGRAIAVGERDVPVDADPERVEQALGNLVDNALLHGAGTVSLEVREAPGLVELHVADEGRGFPDAFAGRAFERFSRADEARGRGGAGLGLAIVDSIAAAHGGSAGVANRDGGGADAWIRLPSSPA